MLGLFVGRLWKGNAGPIALVGLLYLLTLVGFERDGLWTSDNAAKFLQVQALLKSDFDSFAIPWPGRGLDPDFVYNPMPFHFSSVRDGQLYSVFSPVFAFMSSFPYAVLGYWGLYLLPYVSALLILVAVARLCNLLGGGRNTQQVAVLLAGLTTPVWFYAVAFWEHCIAVCLCMWSLYFVARFVGADLSSRSNRDLVYGSCLSSFAVYVRDDLYLFFGVLVLATLVARRGPWMKTILSFGFPMAICLIPLWVWQWMVMGNPLGQHLSTHLTYSEGIVQHIIDRPKVFYNQFVAASPAPIVSIILSAPFLYLWFRRPELSVDKFRTAFPLWCIVAALCCLLAFSGYVLFDSSIAYLLASSNSLFTASPVVIMALIVNKNVPMSCLRRWLERLLLGYAGIYVLAASDLGSAGVHWGNRYLLILYPMWALLAAINLSAWWPFRMSHTWKQLAVVAVISASVGLQLFSIQLLRQKKDFSHRLNDFVATNEGDVVLTSERWAGHELYAVFFDKPVFYVEHPRAMESLLRKLDKAGYDKFLFLSQQPGMGDSKMIGEINDGMLNWYGMKIYSGSTLARQQF